MQKAHSKKAVRSPFLFLLLISVFSSGCATQLSQAESCIASGNTLKQTQLIDKIYLTPDENARKKIALAMDAINRNDFSCSAVKATLKDINKNLHVSHVFKVEAGYLLNLMEKLELLQKEVDNQMQKNEKCVKAREELQKEKEAALKDKNETISDLKSEKEELNFKINTLTETYTKTEKRRKSTP